MEVQQKKSHLIEEIEKKTNRRFAIIIGVIGKLCSGKDTFCDLIKQRGIHTAQGGEFPIEKLLQHLIELKKKGLNLKQQKEEMLKKMKEVHEELAQNFEPRCSKVLDDWKTPTSINGIYIEEEISYLKKRNFFHQIYIDSPILTRYQRFQEKYSQYQNEINLELFCILDESISYGLGLQNVIKHVKVSLLNDGTVDELDELINSKHAKIFRLFKPDWDMYFMKLAVEVKKRSNCCKRSVGAILVSKENRILSTGYNGTPYSIKDCYSDGCARCNSNVGAGKNLTECRCIHAEENCILDIGVRICKELGGTLYTTTFPCKWCAKVIIQSGIQRMVYMEDYDDNQSMDIIDAYQEENQGKQFIIKKQTLENYVY